MKTLKFTTSEPSFMGTIGDKLRYKVDTDNAQLLSSPLKANQAYIHDRAEQIAGYDIPWFFDGDLGQLDRRKEEQDIKMYIDDKVYKIEAFLEYSNSRNFYLLKLKPNRPILEDNGHYWIEVESKIKIGQYKKSTNGFFIMGVPLTLKYDDTINVLSEIILRETS